MRVTLRGEEMALKQRVLASFTCERSADQTGGLMELDAPDGLPVDEQRPKQNITAHTDIVS